MGDEEETEELFYITALINNKESIVEDDIEGLPTAKRLLKEHSKAYAFTKLYDIEGKLLDGQINQELLRAGK